MISIIGDTGRPLGLALLLVLVASAGARAEPLVHVIQLDGAITPVAAEFIHDAIDEAAAAGAACLILELDTPGGLLASTRAICKDILASPVPFVTYVGPAGARAASAGTFVTLAAHVAAMNTSSSIGAAHPVLVGSAQPDSTLDEKAVNDAVSYLRSLAERHGRNADWAEQAVRESISSTAAEALELGVVELVVDDLDALVAALDGWPVELDGDEVAVACAGARIERRRMDLRQRILDTVADPNVAYVLLTLGMLGLMFEIINPGGILPGVAGGIALILALYAMHTLPVNGAGILLIVFALILFVLEVKVPSFGILTIGGIVAMLFGSLMLFDRAPATGLPALRLEVILPVVVLTALFFAFAVTKGILAQRRQPATGSEGLVGEIGVAVEAIATGERGQIEIHGELWSATCGQAVPRGARVRVVAASGLTLEVQPT
jgi:membrane-bound serine protease (ClpP class)